MRTSPIALKKPTPVEEADTIIDIFDNTLFDVIPVIYRRFDDWVLGDKAGTVPPLCPAFFHPGSWIGSDRDGNPNVTAKVSREVAAKYFTHMVLKLEDKCRHIGRNLTLEATYSKPSAELINLWNHQVEMSPRYTARAELISEHEPHRAVMLVMADRLNATVRRITDTMYHSADEFLEDLRVVQRSLAACGAVRAAYGPVQTIIWQVESFGFHMVEMEFRQHSVVHARALKDIHENGIHGDLQPMTREVIDTFRAIGSIQKRYGKKMAHRYIISFTKSAQHVADVFELAHLSFAHEEDVPELDVIPLFEQLEDLEAASTCSIRCLRCPWCKSALPRPTAAWRSCWAIPTLPRMPVLPRPCSRCTPRRSASPSGQRRTISTWCSCTVAAVPWAVAAARPTRPCWRSPRVRSTASLSLPSRARSSLPVTVTARCSAPC